VINGKDPINSVQWSESENAAHPRWWLNNWQTDPDLYFFLPIELDGAPGPMCRELSCWKPYERWRFGTFDGERPALWRVWHVSVLFSRGSLFQLDWDCDGFAIADAIRGSSKALAPLWIAKAIGWRSGLRSPEF
jgi:hypothetical protein